MGFDIKDYPNAYKRFENEITCLEPLTKIQKKWFEEKILKANFSEAIRLNYYTGYALGNKYGNKYMTDSFKTISEHILKSEAYNLQYNDKCRIVKEKHTVKMPLRVNWGGGWSDTPPICCELGGTVLNAAISLNGKLPVEVTLIKITEKKIVFDSISYSANLILPSTSSRHDLFHQ